MYFIIYFVKSPNDVVITKKIWVCLDVSYE